MVCPWSPYRSVMTGSLRQRGPDTWELRVYLGVDRDTGRERWATKTVHGSRRHATARLGEFVEDAGYARLRAGTVADLLDRWMGHASPAWSSTTLAQTRSIVEHHLKPLLGDIRVNKLTTIDIDDMYRSLSRSGGRDGRPLTAGTVHRVHVVLHRALTQAVRWEWIWLNPAANASPPRVTPTEIRPPTPDQIRRLVATVEVTDLDFATYLWLAASTGARRSQMLGLRWADIDFTHSAIGFSRAYVDGARWPRAARHPDPPHLPRRHRPRQHARLVDHYQRSTQRATQHERRLTDKAFVFSAEPDGSLPWLPNRVTKMFINHRRRAAVGQFRLHDLRHFMATEMLAHGVAIVTVSQRLGHARASTTLNVYGHCVPGADRDAADYIAELLTSR